MIILLTVGLACTTPSAAFFFRLQPGNSAGSPGQTLQGAALGAAFSAGIVFRPQALLLQVCYFVIVLEGSCW